MSRLPAFGFSAFFPAVRPAFFLPCWCLGCWDVRICAVTSQQGIGVCQFIFKLIYYAVLFIQAVFILPFLGRQLIVTFFFCLPYLVLKVADLFIPLSDLCLVFVIQGIIIIRPRVSRAYYLGMGVCQFKPEFIDIFYIPRDNPVLVSLELKISLARLEFLYRLHKEGRYAALCKLHQRRPQRHQHDLPCGIGL